MLAWTVSDGAAAFSSRRFHAVCLSLLSATLTFLGHPAIDNATPFAFEALHLIDEECRPLLVPVIKACFDIDAQGRCRPAAAQLPVQVSGECFGDDPETSSYRYEPEVAFHKPATDVVFIGHAYPPASGTREMLVEVRVGALAKRILVYGDRVWFDAAGFPAMSRPLPFERMPLIYERAFGGWDRSDPDPERHTVEGRNPVGTGFRRHGFEEGDRLPNLEDPGSPIRNPGDTPAPAGVGFTCPHWQPRARLAGTYDEQWQKERSPLLPKDFDRRHLNAASAELVAPGYLRGDESVLVNGMIPHGALSFSLPGLPPPSVVVALRDLPRAPIPMALDTVIIEPDLRRVMLLWRGHLRLRTGPHDVAEIYLGAGTR